MGTVILLPKHHIEHLSETIDVITETMRSDGIETPSIVSGEGRVTSSLLQRNYSSLATEKTESRIQKTLPRMYTPELYHHRSQKEIKQFEAVTEKPRKSAKQSSELGVNVVTQDDLLSYASNRSYR